jgi:predicted TIM-barrel fold metal-dependent hydrolase
MKKFDTHLHVIYPHIFTYSWTEAHPRLQNNFTLEDYYEVAKDCDIEQSLFMEVDVNNEQYVQEAKFLTGLCEDPSNMVTGVVAKCLPESSEFIKNINLLQNYKLKGIRRVLHTQPDSLSRSKIFRRNIRYLANLGLTFDLCVMQNQLDIADELVSDCPKVNFILDHCGVPNMSDHKSLECESWKQWRSGIRKLAEKSNVVCKFSGISSYGNAGQRNVERLRPYLTEILEAFGVDRIIWGSDWPVCNLGDGLSCWSMITDKLLGELSEDEQNSIAFQNAEIIYNV